MDITPDEIENRVFSLVRRGYDPTEVDDFLRDVAATLARAQGGLATPSPRPAAAPATADGDDFERLGDEVASILRQAHESVDALRHRAEADAALIRQNAERDAVALRQDAEADRQRAAIELESARAETARALADVQRQAQSVADTAAAMARARVHEVVESARIEARGAIVVQRNVRGRLEDTRAHIDGALDRLLEEDEDLFATIDLTDAAVDPSAAAAPAEDEPTRVPPGEGPPTPPVPPPTRTAPLDIADLPYDTAEDEPAPTIDLRGDEDAGRDEDGGGGDHDEDGGGTGPTPPEPGPGRGGGAAAEPDPPADEAEDDPLAQMVKNAVENALRRRKGDTDPPEDDQS